MAQYSSHILEMARKGAEHQYEELKGEIAALIRIFPHLGKGGQVSEARSKRSRAIRVDAEVVHQRGRKMSAAARRAVSRRMKKYWAMKRQEKAKIA